MTEGDATKALEGYYAVEARCEEMAAKLGELETGNRCAQTYQFYYADKKDIWFNTWCRGDADTHSEPLSALWDASWDADIARRLAEKEYAEAHKAELAAQAKEQEERALLATLKAKYD